MNENNENQFGDDGTGPAREVLRQASLRSQMRKNTSDSLDDGGIDSEHGPALEVLNQASLKSRKKTRVETGTKVKRKFRQPVIVNFPPSDLYPSGASVEYSNEYPKGRELMS